MKTKHIIGIGLVVVLFTGLLAIQHMLNSPRRTFEKLLQTPIPNSVRLIDQGKLSSMDSNFVVLHFQISKSDLQALLSIQHFVPIDESSEFRRWDQNSKGYIQIQKEEFFRLWQQRIRNSTGLEVLFTNAWQIYTLKEGGGEKYIFSDENGMEVVFVADAH